MRLPAGMTQNAGMQHNRSGAFGQQGFQQYSPSQAQPQQQQSQGTAYNPQQGGNFAAYAPQPRASGPTVHEIQQQQLDARRASNAQRQAEVTRARAPKQQAPAQQQGFQPMMQAGAPGMMGFQQPAGLSQFAGMDPMGFNPFGNIPPFQFTGTDFMGNRFDNPGAMNAQQGATVQALNQQRAQQIGNMFNNGTPLSSLNPALAYQQGQQMLGGGFQNPFAAPGMAQPVQQPSFGTPYSPQQDFQLTPPAGAQMARPGQDGAQQGYRGMQQPSGGAPSAAEQQARQEWETYDRNIEAQRRRGSLEYYAPPRAPRPPGMESRPGDPTPAEQAEMKRREEQRWADMIAGRPAAQAFAR